jgi:hypothetical protein
LTEQIEGFVTASGFADGVDGRIRLEELLEPSANDCMIVGDQYS